MKVVTTFTEPCHCGEVIPVQVVEKQRYALVYMDGSYTTAIHLVTDDTDWFAHQWTHEG